MNYHHHHHHYDNDIEQFVVDEFLDPIRYQELKKILIDLKSTFYSFGENILVFKITIDQSTNRYRCRC